MNNAKEAQEYLYVLSGTEEEITPSRMSCTGDPADQEDVMVDTLDNNLGSESDINTERSENEIYFAVKNFGNELHNQGVDEGVIQSQVEKLFTKHSKVRVMIPYPRKDNLTPSMQFEAIKKSALDESIKVFREKGLSGKSIQEQREDWSLYYGLRWLFIGVVKLYNRIFIDIGIMPDFQTPEAILSVLNLDDMAAAARKWITETPISIFGGTPMAQELPRDQSPMGTIMELVLKCSTTTKTLYPHVILKILLRGQTFKYHRIKPIQYDSTEIFSLHVTIEVFKENGKEVLKPLTKFEDCATLEVKACISPDDFIS
jgi:hypothetical protein